MGILDEIAVEFGATQGEIVKLVASAAKRYKSYLIDKRNGGKRIIAQPASELKLVQRFIMEQKLSAFPIHDIAMAYVQGRNILDNAKRHSSSNFLLKLDFNSFFPSILPRDLERANRRLKPSPLEKSDLEFYYRLLYWGEGTYVPTRLSIGAPSSPMISNIVMYQLDCEAADLAARLGLVVTRYADDITVSGSSKEAIAKFEGIFRKVVLATKSPKLTFNDAKRGFYGRGERRMVTGLVITPDGKISIGRERKRTISALVHRFTLGEVDHAETMRIKGLIGFALSVDPTYISKLKAKYGKEPIESIMAADYRRVVEWDLDEEG